jgi:hypothetical protein
MKTEGFILNKAVFSLISSLKNVLNAVYFMSLRLVAVLIWTSAGMRNLRRPAWQRLGKENKLKMYIYILA